MKYKAIITSFLFILFYYSNSVAQKVNSRPLPSNPISYIFKIPIDSARFALERSFFRYNTLKFRIHDVYYRGTGKRSAWPEVAKKILLQEDNKYDVWMNISVDSSDIYFKTKQKPLEYKMVCVAHFTAIDDNITKIEIKVIDAKVHLRDRLLPSPPHFINNPIYKKVKPTTIEEYKVIQFLGKYLGVINQMPALKVH